jgi:hypothetical protein
MKHVLMEVPTFGFIVATRAALGVGLGLLLASRIPESRRRAMGMALVAIGVATTIPAVMALVNGARAAETGTDGW